MGYYFSTTLDEDFDSTVSKTKEALGSQGFGVLTEIDIKDTMKQKLDIEMDKYQILGACNPPMAYEALQTEEHIGLMLPCNVIVRAVEDGKTEVAAVDPVSSMQAVPNRSLNKVAEQVRKALKEVISSLK